MRRPPSNTPKTLHAALNYLKRGWYPIPIPPGRKSPTIKNWQNLRLAEEDIRRVFAKPCNIGVLLGEPSNGLIDIDLDHPIAAKLAPVFLPPTGAVFGRASKPASHWLYLCAGAKTTKWVLTRKEAQALLSEAKECMLVELRSTGCQTVFPPSVHPSGEVIEWATEGEPAEVDKATLERACAKLAAATLLALTWPKEGTRQETALALAGALLRVGWNEEEVTEFIQAVAEAAGDEEARKRIDTVMHTARKLNNSPTTGWPRLAQLVGEETTRKLQDWLGIRENRHSATPAPSGALILPVLPLTKAVEKLKALGEGNWLIEKLLPERGFAIFASRPKLGKTDTLLRVVANILLESPCFGREVQPAKILWITQEDTLERLQNSLLAHGVDPATVEEKCFVIDYTQTAGFLTGESLIATAKEYGCQLVILEPLAALAELATLGRKGRLNYEAIYGVLNPLALKAKQTGVLLLGVWHSSRGKTRLASVEDVIDAPMGSTAYSAVADSILALGLPPDTADPGLRRIMAVGRGVQLDYLLQWNGVGYEEAGEFTGEEALSEGQRKLLGLLKVLGEATPSQLATALGENPNTVRSWLHRLGQKGLVLRIGGGYRIASFSSTCGKEVQKNETHAMPATGAPTVTESVARCRRAQHPPAVEPQALQAPVASVAGVTPICGLPKQATWEGTVDEYLRNLRKT